MHHPLDDNTGVPVVSPVALSDGDCGDFGDDQSGIHMPSASALLYDYASFRVHMQRASIATRM